MSSKYIVNYSKLNQNYPNETSLDMTDKGSCWQSLMMEYEKRNLELALKQDILRNRMRNILSSVPAPPAKCNNETMPMCQYGLSVRNSLPFGSYALEKSFMNLYQYPIVDHAACSHTSNFRGNFHTNLFDLECGGRHKGLNSITRSGPVYLPNHHTTNTREAGNVTIEQIKLYMKQLDDVLHQKLQEARQRPKSASDESLKEFYRIKESVNNLISHLGCVCKKRKDAKDKREHAKYRHEFTKSKNEVHRLDETLSMQGAMGDYSKSGESSDDSLNGIARQLSRTLFEIENCGKCKSVRAETKDAVTSIKEVVDLLNKLSSKKEERSNNLNPLVSLLNAGAIKPQSSVTNSVLDDTIQTVSSKQAVSIGVGTEIPVTVSTETINLVNLLTENISTELTKRLSNHLPELSNKKQVENSSFTVQNEKSQTVLQKDFEESGLIDTFRSVGSEYHLKKNLCFDLENDVGITFILDKFGTLHKVLTEGPDGTIDSTVHYTTSGNLNVATEIVTFLEDGPNKVLLESSSMPATLLTFSDLCIKPSQVVPDANTSCSKNELEKENYNNLYFDDSLSEQSGLSSVKEKLARGNFSETPKPTKTYSKIEFDHEYPKEGGDFIDSITEVEKTSYSFSEPIIEGENVLVKKDSDNTSNEVQSSIFVAQKSETIDKIDKKESSAGISPYSLERLSAKHFLFDFTSGTLIMNQNEVVPKTICFRVIVEEPPRIDLPELQAAKSSYSDKTEASDITDVTEYTFAENPLDDERVSTLKEIVTEDELELDFLIETKADMSQSFSADDTLTSERIPEDELILSDITDEDFSSLTYDIIKISDDNYPIVTSIREECVRSIPSKLDTISEESTADLKTHSCVSVNYEQTTIQTQQWQLENTGNGKIGIKEIKSNSDLSKEEIVYYDTIESSNLERENSVNEIGMFFIERWPLTERIILSTAEVVNYNLKKEVCVGTSSEKASDSSGRTSISDISEKGYLRTEVIKTLEKANQKAMDALDEANRDVAEIIQEVNRNTDFAIKSAVEEQSGLEQKESGIVAHEAKGMVNLSVGGRKKTKRNFETIPLEPMTGEPIDPIYMEMLGLTTRQAYTVPKKLNVYNTRKKLNKTSFPKPIKRKPVPQAESESRPQSPEDTRSIILPKHVIKTSTKIPVKKQPSWVDVSTVTEQEQKGCSVSSLSMFSTYSGKKSFTGSSESNYLHNSENQESRRTRPYRQPVRYGHNTSKDSYLTRRYEKSQNEDTGLLKKPTKSPGKLSPQGEDQMLRRPHKKNPQKEPPDKNFDPHITENKTREEKVLSKKRICAIPKCKSLQETMRSGMNIHKLNKTQSLQEKIKQDQKLIPNLNITSAQDEVNMNKKAVKKLAFQEESPNQKIKIKPKAKALEKEVPSVKKVMIKAEADTFLSKKATMRSKFESAQEERQLDKRVGNSQKNVQPPKRPYLKCNARLQKERLPSKRLCDLSKSKVSSPIPSDEEMSMLTKSETFHEDIMSNENLHLLLKQIEEVQTSINEVNAGTKSLNVSFQEKVFSARQSFIKSANQTLKQAVSLVGKLPVMSSGLKDSNSVKNSKLPVKTSHSKIWKSSIRQHKASHRLTEILEQVEDSDDAVTSSTSLRKLTEETSKSTATQNRDGQQTETANKNEQCQTNDDAGNNMEATSISTHTEGDVVVTQKSLTNTQENIHKQVGDVLHMDKEVIEVEEETQRRKQNWYEKHPNPNSDAFTINEQTLTYHNAISNLQFKLSSLYDQCRQKDHIIASMLQALQIKPHLESAIGDFAEVSINNLSSPHNTDTQYELINEEQQKFLNENLAAMQQSQLFESVVKKDFPAWVPEISGRYISPVLEQMSTPYSRKLSRAWGATKIQSLNPKYEEVERSPRCTKSHQRTLKMQSSTKEVNTSIPVICLPFPVRPQTSSTCERTSTPVSLLDSSGIKFPTIKKNKTVIPASPKCSALKITEVRRIASNSLIVRWTPPVIKVIGFEVLVDGIIKSRICNPKVTSVVLNKLTFDDETVSVVIYGLTPTGRYQPPTKIVFKCT